MAQSDVIRLKLLIDTKAQRVLFGEADKNFIDFLFNLLSLPLATVIRLLKNQTKVGSLRNLYESVETLSDTYLQPNQSKDTILKPKVSICGSSTMLLPNIEYYSSSTTSTTTTTFYLCSNNSSNYMGGSCRHSVSDGPGAICSTCNNSMNQVGTYVKPPTSETASTQATRRDDQVGGFVKGVVTYMVMDDLIVMPMSTISSITLLNKFNIKEVGALEEKIVTLDVNEGVKLLEASLRSNTVLTDVFLGRILTVVTTPTEEVEV